MAVIPGEPEWKFDATLGEQKKKYFLYQRKDQVRQKIKAWTQGKTVPNASGEKEVGTEESGVPSWQISLDQLQIGTDTLGRGPFGQVIKGEYRGKAVAVKQISGARGDVQYPEKEITCLLQLQHPNIVPVFGVGFAGQGNELGTAFLISELMEGETSVPSSSIQHTPLIGR